MAFVPRKKQPQRARPALRRENVQTERLNLYIPAEVATALRVRCAETRRSISDGVTEALLDWLQRQRVGKR